MKAIILLTRLSDYMLNCFRAWQAESGVELHVVRRKVDESEAPFEFSDEFDGITFYERETMDRAAIDALVKRLEPQLVICFGWADRDYLSAVRRRPVGTTAVMTMDNQWLGTFRQRLGMVRGRLSIARLFDYIWVPGPRQHRFARLLGFREDQVREGLYVANAANFAPIRETFDGPPAKRLVFVGRYIDIKGARELWKGFVAYHDKVESNLELVSIGSGALRVEAPEHPRIRHLGFVQPKDLAEALEGGGVFVLPSKHEPWGLVVHEFALAGFPLVLSQAVGAGDRFLGADNGLLLEAVTPEAITEAIAAIDGLEPEALAAMSRASVARAGTLTVEDWCAQADAFLTAGGGG